MYIETRAYLEDEEIEQFKALTAASKLAAEAVLEAEVEAVIRQLRQRPASSQEGGSIPRHLWDDLRLRRREGELSESLEISLSYGDHDQRAMVLVHEHVERYVEPWKLALVAAAHDFELEFVSEGVQIRREPVEVKDIDGLTHGDPENNVPPPVREAFYEILTAALFDRIEDEQNHVDILAGDRETSDVDLVEYSIGSRMLGILQENGIYGWNSILFDNMADILNENLDGTAEDLRDLVLESIERIDRGVANDLLQWEGMRDAMITADLMPFLESLSAGLNKYLDT